MNKYTNIQTKQLFTSDYYRLTMYTNGILFTTVYNTKRNHLMTFVSYTILNYPIVSTPVESM